MKTTITSYSEKGYGAGECQKGKAHVLAAVKGDELLIEVLKKKRGTFLSKIKEIYVASPDRVEPRCPHVGLCGGCSWQQMSYSAQRELKQDKIAKLFAPFPVNPILFPEDPWEYRNKMEFSFSQNRAGDRFLGLVMAGSKGLVFDVTSCAIASPPFVSILKAVKSWWEETKLRAYHGISDEGSLRTLTVREGKRTGQFLVMLTVSGNPHYGLRKSEIEAFKRAVIQVAGQSVSLFIRIQQIAKGRPTQFFEMHIHGPEWIEEQLNISSKSIKVCISPSSFFQPNTVMAERMYTKAIEMLKLTREDTVFDLYCGIGSIGMSLAPHCKKVLGIELNPYAVFDARHNLTQNNITNMEIFRGDVAEVLSEKSALNPDVIVLDPPRMGLGPKAIQEVIALKPKKILYISCNPKTQAQDIKTFLDEGYLIKEIQPIDQFPHTVHIENIILLICP